MALNENTFRLVQKDKSYLLSMSVDGDGVLITLKNELNPASTVSRSFSVETWQGLGSIFESVLTPLEVIQWLNYALKVHKVKIIEGISETKIVFFIVFNKMLHKVEIPLGGGSQMIPQVNTASSLTRLSTIANVSEVSTPTQYVPQVSLPKPQYVPQVSLPKPLSVPQVSLPAPQYAPQVTILKPQYLPTTYITTDSTQYTTTDFTQYITTDSNDTTNDTTCIKEIGLDPTKIVSQTWNPNTNEIIKSIEAEKNLRLSQIGTVITTYNKPLTSDFEIPSDNDFDLNHFTNTETYNQNDSESLPYITPADDISGAQN